MAATRPEILHHVLMILEIDTELQQLFIFKGNYSAKNIIHTNHETYQPLVKNPHSKLFLVDIDQIFIIQNFHFTTFSKILTATEDDILYKITEKQWDSF